MYRSVVDSETTDINKCFCYDIGYLIFNDEDFSIVKEKHFVIEQVWHNLELFQSAYYVDKRPQYINLMRTKKATMEKWGYVMQEMIRDFKRFNITDVYAYNSPFDDKVFSFNCDWFKTQNPFDNIEIHDIWGYACEKVINTPEYKDFCEKWLRFTDSGNYSGTAETVYQFLTNNPAFVEEHMGLYDSQIEMKILQKCVDLGLSLDEHYKVTKIWPRPISHPYTITVNGNVIHEGEYVKKSVYKDNFKFIES